MTGSLQTKKGNYYAVITYKDERGKWRHKWIPTGISEKGSNKRKAENELNRIIKELQEKDINFDSDILFVAALQRWLQVEKLKVDIVTFEGYSHTVQRHLIPYFESWNLHISQVTSDHIQNYYIYKLEHGRLDGKGGLSAKSLKQHHTVLQQVFTYMKKAVIRDPLQDVVVAKPEKYEATFYNAQEAEILLRASQDSILGPIILTTLLYGLRRSEVLGLKWDAVDLTEKTVTIKSVVVHNFTVVHKNDTKNTASKRTYPLLEPIEKLLLQLKARQVEDKQVNGRNYIESDYIFRWPDGRLIRPDYVSMAFQRIIKRNNLRHLRFHDLRHSCASILISMGYSLKDIQEWLGHSDIKMTGNIYGHLEYARKMVMGDNFSQKLAEANQMRYIENAI